MQVKMVRDFCTLKKDQIYDALQTKEHTIVVDISGSAWYLENNDSCFEIQSDEITILKPSTGEVTTTSIEQPIRKERLVLNTNDIEEITIRFN